MHAGSASHWSHAASIGTNLRPSSSQVRTTVARAPHHAHESFIFRPLALAAFAALDDVAPRPDVAQRTEHSRPRASPPVAHVGELGGGASNLRSQRSESASSSNLALQDREEI